MQYPISGIYFVTGFNCQGTKAMKVTSIVSGLKNIFAPFLNQIKNIIVKNVRKENTFLLFNNDGFWLLCTNLKIVVGKGY